MKQHSEKLETSYLHRGGETPLVGWTVDRAFGESVRRFPDREAIVSLPQGRRLTYAQLDRAVAELARGLLALDIAPGDRVGIWSTDNIEWLILQLASARIGAVLVNVNPAYRVYELEHALTQAEVGTLFLIPRFRSSDYVGMVRSLCPELDQPGSARLDSRRLPALRRVVVYDAADPLATAPPGPGWLTWRQVIEAGSALPDEAVAERAGTLDCDDPINIQFTSGTTGFPKGVELTHHNIVNNGFQVAERLGFTELDRLCVPVPFYHCFGMVISNLGCLTHGAAIVVPAEHFDAGAVLEAVAAERCTALHGVPTMFIAELEHPRFAELDTSSLRTGIMAGAPCPPEIVRRVMEEMGIGELLIAYGQTEASPVTHTTLAGDSFERRVETVGTNMPFQEVKVVDVDSGRVLPVDEQGEVCVRGYNVMRGYFRQPEVTAETVDAGGWLHTGDLGVMDADGYLRITGRIKEMIIRGGENIYPAEIEAFYHRHPQVAQVAVFGLPDEKMGEEVGAWIRLREGAQVTPEELREYARGHIAHYKVPRHIWLVDEFPTTVTGKVQKFRIRDIAAGWLKDESRELVTV